MGGTTVIEAQNPPVRAILSAAGWVPVGHSNPRLSMAFAVPPSLRLCVVADVIGES
jgi:hypothetical protein